MKKRKELQGLAVMDVSGGKKLGSIEDLVISPEDGRVLGLTLGGGGMLGGSRTFVSADDIRSIGADAVTVEGDNVARPESEMSEELSAARDASRSLVGKKVVTEGGSLLGTVSDYLVDESARRVSGLTVGGGMLSAEDAIAADRIVSLGPDAVIVSDEAGDTDREGTHAPWAGR